MSNNEEKLGNGLGADPLQRLASFKTPRDLSLGTPQKKPNKKVFTPNLNAPRNKNKGPSTTNAREQKRDDNTKRDNKNNKWNKNHGPNIIKSSGVFSDGLGAVERHTSRGSRGKDGEPAPALHKPTIRVKNEIKVDKDLEDKKIKSAFGDGVFGDDIGEDFKKALDIHAPIKLPMEDGGALIKSKAVVKVKQEPFIKMEPEDDSASVTLEQKPKVEVKKEFIEDSDAVNLLNSEQPTLILLQLPVTLPGRGGSVDDDMPRRKPSTSAPSTSASSTSAPSTSASSTSAPSTSAAETTPEDPVDDRCLLKNLEEGCIGKLQVRRSGRVTLLLGETVFEVRTGTNTAFHQEIVSVAADDDTRSANLVSLGQLCNKLTAVPEWDTLFTHMSV